MIMTSRRVNVSVMRALELAEDLKTEVGERTAALSEANATLRKLTNAIEQAAEMVVITDLDGRIEYVEPRC